VAGTSEQENEYSDSNKRRIDSWLLASDRYFFQILDLMACSGSEFIF
jgi:hypothetical protein